MLKGSLRCMPGVQLSTVICDMTNGAGLEMLNARSGEFSTLTFC